MRARFPLVLAVLFALSLAFGGTMPAQAQSTTVFTATNVVLAPAPPAYYLPSANGAPIAAGATHYVLTVDTTGLNPNNLDPAPALGDFAVEYFDTAQGKWVQNVAVGGALVGPYQLKGGGTTMVVALLQGDIVVASRSLARIRVDSTPGYTVPRVTLTES